MPHVGLLDLFIRRDTLKHTVNRRMLYKGKMFYHMQGTLMKVFYKFLFCQKKGHQVSFIIPFESSEVYLDISHSSNKAGGGKIRIPA